MSVSDEVDDDDEEAGADEDDELEAEFNQQLYKHVLLFYNHYNAEKLPTGVIYASFHL